MPHAAVCGIFQRRVVRVDLLQCRRAKVGEKVLRVEACGEPGDLSLVGSAQAEAVGEVANEFASFAAEVGAFDDVDPKVELAAVEEGFHFGVEVVAIVSPGLGKGRAGFAC